MIKQVCFNTLKNDIFGSTIINYTSLTVNHRKQRRSCLRAIKPKFNRWIWGKNKCILSSVHKKWTWIWTYTSRSSLKWELKRRSCLRAIKPKFNRWIWGKNKCILSSVHKKWTWIWTYTSRSSLKWENHESAVGAAKACYSFDCSVLIVTNFNTCWLQFSFSIMLWHFIYI